MKKLLIILAIALASQLFMGQLVKADSVPGDVIITIGKDLTQEQKDMILGKMGADESTIIIEITNEQEHKYLGNYLPKAKIGSKSISSARITIGNEGDGLIIDTENINWVTQDMYKNALSTAGVKDATVLVTAPFSVSGTAALTGILNAYETSMNIEIPEEQKQIANEELVKTAQLGDTLGSSEKATELMSLIKAAISENKPQTTEELQEIIVKAAESQGIQLNKDELNGLLDLFGKMKDMNIDWNVVGENLTVAKEKLNEFLNQEETKNLIEKLGDFFKSLVDAIKGWFN